MCSDANGRAKFSFHGRTTFLLRHGTIGVQLEIGGIIDRRIPKHSPQRARKEARRQREEGREVKFAYEWRYFSGTLVEMPILLTVDSMLEASDNAIAYAQSVRKHHARKTKKGSKQRETDLKLALERMADAMKPIRSRIGRSPYEANMEGLARLREASDALQKERRKLWKMQAKKPKDDWHKKRKIVSNPDAAPDPGPPPKPEAAFGTKNERLTLVKWEIRRALWEAEHPEEEFKEPEPSA